MRIATSQLYSSGTERITSQQSRVNDQWGHLSSGKRVDTAKDDPVASGTISRLQNELDRNGLYTKNADLAQSRNDIMEQAINSVSEAIDRAKQALIQSNSGAYDGNDLATLAEELKASYDHVFELANSTDENGNYLFSGYQTEQQPFTKDGNGNLSYNGDNGIRQLLIGSGLLIPTSQPGDSVFMEVPNALGDFMPDYGSNTGGARLENAEITDRGNYDATRSPFSLNFTDTNNDGQLELTITDALGASTAPVAYTPGQDIAFNGVTVKLDGNPLPGDSIELSQQSQTDVFTALGDAIDWLSDSAENGTRDQVDYSNTLAQLNSAFDYMTTRQSATGARSSTIEGQKDYLENYNVTLDESKGRLESLDYASAISDYQQTEIALQISQQLFTQINRTSLLDFI